MIQLAYVSKAAAPMTDDELLALLTKSRKNNFKRGVGGILLYRDGLFFQMLEGKEADVDAIFAKVQQDPRHHDVNVLSRQPTSTRSFMDWRMGFVTPEALIQANPAFSEALISGSERFDSDFVEALVSLFRSGAMAALISDG
ncbi:MAG: BLUF domain-containing protein [Deltaproteobacteria bacterium]|nr:BLUF domain-containing protein [Deltaproteobacteria bacterium]